MDPSLDFDLLRTFVAVADEAGFERAARRLNRSPPAVSMRIKRLEDAIGAAVCARDTRNLTLTNEGETLLAYARRILELNSEALDALRARRIAGRVRIGAPDDYAASLLPGPLRRFAARFPNVEVELVCEQSTALVPKVKGGAVDLAFVTRARGIDGVFVRREKMVWVGTKTGDIWKKRPLPLALYEPGSVARKHVQSALARAGIGHRVAYESPSHPGLLCVVEAGLAVAAVAACAVPRGLAILGRREGLPDLAPLEIVAIAGPGAAAPPGDALAAAILESLGEAPGAPPPGRRRTR